MQRPLAPTPKGKGKNKAGFTTEVSLLNLITLYVNLYKAKEDEQVGYQNIEESIKWLNERLSRYSYFIKHKELEGLLWACQQMDEQGKFWNAPHPEQKFKTFVNNLLNYKHTQLYFNEVYSWINKKPRRGRPSAKGGNK